MALPFVFRRHNLFEEVQNKKTCIRTVSVINYNSYAGVVQW